MTLAKKRKKDEFSTQLVDIENELRHDRNFAFEEMRGELIWPWSKGGKKRLENLQMLCADCNARKSDKF